MLIIWCQNGTQDCVTDVADRQWEGVRAMEYETSRSHQMKSLNENHLTINLDTIK